MNGEKLEDKNQRERSGAAADYASSRSPWRDRLREEPPAIDKLVLMYNDDPQDSWRGARRVIGYRADDGAYYDHEGVALRRVTHWMPLPRPPEEA